MGKFIDFRIYFDPNTETESDKVKKILCALFLRPTKFKKPVNTFIGGDSGEGKSAAAIWLESILLEAQGIDINDCFADINILTPFEYPKKLDNILFQYDHNKRLKKVNILTMHEAREIVKAKNWQDFLAQAVADVNAQSRAIKRLIFIIISQFIRDITTDVRYTLNYYITAYRPLGKRTQLRIQKMWKDDADLERPKLRKRLIRGYIHYPDGHVQLHIPKYIEFEIPPKELMDKFEEMDRQAKTLVIRKKIDKLIQKMQVELEVQDSKVDAMVEWYSSNQDKLHLIGKYTRKKWKVQPEIKLMHGLTDSESCDFEAKLNDKLVKMQGITLPPQPEGDIEDGE